MISKEKIIFWIIFLIWGVICFTALYFLKLVTPFKMLSSRINIVEQVFYSLVLAPYPAFLVYCLMKKSGHALSFQRMLLAGTPSLLLIFLLQIAGFVIFILSRDVNLPVHSTLYDPGLMEQISTYSRVPILSQFIAIMLFLPVYASKAVNPGEKICKAVWVGLIFYAVYVVGFVLANIWWQSYLEELILPPNKVNLFMLFIHWLPTVYFLVLTYIYSQVRRSEWKGV